MAVTINAYSYQNASSLALLVLMYSLLLWYSGFAIASLLSVTQYLQLNVEIFIITYTSGSAFLTMIWIISTRWFVLSYKPNRDAKDEDRITDGELNKNYSVQLSALISCVFIGSLGIFLFRSLDREIGSNDGYFVREGMDTSSNLYTLWLCILFSIIINSFNVISRSPYMIHLYGFQFRKIFKPSLA